MDKTPISSSNAPSNILYLNLRFMFYIHVLYTKVDLRFHVESVNYIERVNYEFIKR